MKFEIFEKNNKKWLKIIFSDGFTREAMIYGIKTNRPFVKIDGFKCDLRSETIKQLRSIA